MKDNGNLKGNAVNAPNIPVWFPRTFDGDAKYAWLHFFV